MQDAIRKAFLDIMDGTEVSDLGVMTGLPTDRCKEIVNLYKLATCGDTITCYKTSCAWNHNNRCEHSDSYTCSCKIRNRPKNLNKET